MEISGFRKSEKHASILHKMQNIKLFCVPLAHVEKTSTKHSEKKKSLPKVIVARS